MMRFTGERVVPGMTPPRIYADHLARYEFSEVYVRSKQVLDAACGTGYGSATLLARGAARVSGIDISAESIQYASGHFANRQTQFAVGNVKQLPFINQCFDVVVSFETLEHLTGVPQYLTEVSRVLRADGTFIVSSPNRVVTSPGYPRPIKIPRNEFHVAEYSRKELNNLLFPHFEDVAFFGQRHVLGLFCAFPIWKVLSKLSSRAGERLLAGGSPKVTGMRPLLMIPRYWVAVCRGRRPKPIFR